MKYAEFIQRDHFDLHELLAIAHGKLIEDPPKDFKARLPAPPFLMFDRIIEITRNGRQGSIKAEQDIRFDAWFFQCHFLGDPVQPGCLCVDAIWQLLGLYCLWMGGIGTGRALGCGEIFFSGQIRPFNRVVRYEIDIRRFSNLKDSGASIVIGDGRFYVDGELIGTVSRARSGLFRGIDYPDYPNRSANSVGGTIKGEHD